MISVSSEATRVISNLRKKPPSEKDSPRSLRISSENTTWRPSSKPNEIRVWAIAGPIQYDSTRSAERSWSRSYARRTQCAS